MRGSCLCKAVEYEVDALSSNVSFCHCKTCRKAHAAPFNATAVVKREQFRWTKGEDKLAAYESSPGKLRHFCSVCGSHLLAELVGKPNVVLRVATLDEDPGVRGERHVWTSHNVAWLNYKDLTEYPEGAPAK